jgi:hypothetical protein
VDEGLPLGLLVIGLAEYLHEGEREIGVAFTFAEVGIGLLDELFGGAGGAEDDGEGRVYFGDGERGGSCIIVFHCIMRDII